MSSPTSGLKKNSPATRSTLLSKQSSESMTNLINSQYSSQSTVQLVQKSPQKMPMPLQSIPSVRNTETSPNKKQSECNNSKKSDDSDPEIVQISQDLISGDIESNSIEASKISKVNLYLRKYKKKVLKEPDYFTAQRIEDVCSELTLLSTQNTYCNYRSSEIKTVTDHLKKAKSELNNILNERQKFQSIFDDQKAKKLEKLQQKQQKELDALDEKYKGEVPPRFKKLSAEVLNIRQQEAHLRNAKLYLEAQRMKEEADALEAFELARQEVKFHNEGVECREKLNAVHANQVKCLLENLDRQYATTMPVSLEQEKHWRQVIAQYERQLRKLRGDSREVKKVTNSMLSANTGARSGLSQRDANSGDAANKDETLNDKGKEKGPKGLPSLGKKVPQTPMTRVLKINNKRTYSRFGMRRPKSSAF